MNSAQKHIVIDARNRRSSTGRYTDRLIQHLQTVGSEHRFTIVLQSDDPWEPSRDDFSTAYADFPQFSFNPLNDIKFAYFLRSLKPDLVHFTMTQQPLTYRGANVTTTHDLTMLRFVRAGKTPAPIFWLKKLGYRTLFYVAHQKTKAVIVPSEFVATDLNKLFDFTKDKTHVTYESSEPPIDTPANPLKGTEKPFIFHVGSPFPHKNIDHLIKSFEKLLVKNPKLTLVLAGKKEHYFTELEAWARERPSSKRIRFTGFIKDEELKWLYQNAEAYVIPSLSEGFGLPGLEAMAHDCPLVSSNATCMPEVYGDAAHYFDPHDIDDTARAIQDVLSSNTLRKKLVTAGRQQIKQYSWRRMAQQTHEVYESVLI